MKIQSIAALALLVSLLQGCESTPGGVGNKVLTDFGIRKPAEGTTTGTDMVYQKLPEVGKAEMDRLNAQERRGAVKFKQDGLHGVYVKRIKKYETAYPVDATPVSSNSQTVSLAGFNGYIEYAYRVYESAPKTSSTEAQASDADIPTDETGRETYRYTFGTSGAWDGNKGQRTKTDSNTK